MIFTVLLVLNAVLSGYCLYLFGRIRNRALLGNLLFFTSLGYLVITLLMLVPPAPIKRSMDGFLLLTVMTSSLVCFITLGLPRYTRRGIAGHLSGIQRALTIRKDPEPAPNGPT